MRRDGTEMMKNLFHLWCISRRFQTMKQRTATATEQLNGKDVVGGGRGLTWCNELELVRSDWGKPRKIPAMIISVDIPKGRISYTNREQHRLRQLAPYEIQRLKEFHFVSSSVPRMGNAIYTWPYAKKLDRLDCKTCTMATDPIMLLVIILFTHFYY
jgi:hypothetical protein